MEQLRSREALEETLGKSEVILFKHSPRCPISRAAHQEMTGFAAGNPDASVYLIDVIEDRSISNLVAERTAVKHESPQVIIQRQPCRVACLSSRRDRRCRCAAPGRGAGELKNSGRLMGGVKIIYSEKYTLPLGDHVFPAEKYGRTKDRLVEQALCAAGDFVEPRVAQDDEIALVHTREYIEKLKHGHFSPGELAQMEVPYSRELADAFWIATGGTIEACRQALRHGCAITLCGGFHHAFPDHGEGFCLVNDVAVAIRALQRSGEIRTAMTVDCDVHQGNGTAHIFRDDPSVFTLSIHQYWNYPLTKPPSDLDINLVDSTGSAEYLLRLGQGLDEALGTLHPDLMIYLAGADPYEDDQLGGLALTLAGLEARDRFVFEKARALATPIAVTLAGGYARHVDDTVTIHAGTVKAALEYFSSRAPLL